MPVITVMHEYYGCDSGCCGHVIRVDDHQVGQFHFEHPRHLEPMPEFVKRLVEEHVGEECLGDIDWSGCLVSDD